MGEAHTHTGGGVRRDLLHMRGSGWVSVMLAPCTSALAQLLKCCSRFGSGWRQCGRRAKCGAVARHVLKAEASTGLGSCRRTTRNLWIQPTTYLEAMDAGALLGGRRYV